MGRKNKSSNEADPQDEGGATETPDQSSSKNDQKEEEKNGAQEGKFNWAFEKRWIDAPQAISRYHVIIYKKGWFWQNLSIAPKATPKKDPAPKPKTSDNKNDAVSIRL